MLPQAVAALAALLALAVPGAAQITIRDVRWQLAQGRSQLRVHTDLDRWLLPPGPAERARPLVRVTLANGAARPETAVLLRYAFSARLRRIGVQGDGTWTVPFLVEERRIPNVPGRAEKPVRLYVNRVAFHAYLKRMYRAGFWPDALKVEVMVEPRPGETLDGRIAERVLTVRWRRDEDD